MSLLTINEVFDQIRIERQYQDEKWGSSKQQSLPGFFAILRAELAEAEHGWLKNLEGRHAPLNELVQLAATAVACLEKYGVDGSTLSTDDYTTK